MEIGSLQDRVALVTGLSRPESIGREIADRLHSMGATVIGSGWSAHDEAMPWGKGSLEGKAYAVTERDLSVVGEPNALVDEVFEGHGRLDILVATHARSSTQPLGELTDSELHLSWSANVQSVLMLAQRFASRHVPADGAEPPTGRMIWFTSGQHLGPMESNLAYAVSKGGAGTDDNFG